MYAHACAQAVHFQGLDRKKNFAFKRFWWFAGQMAEEIDLTFAYHGLDGWHVERLAQITESEFFVLHGFATLSC